MPTTSDSTVLGVVMVVRSGDRLYEPQYAYQSKVDSPSTSGSLTPLGEQQELQLGGLLRSIYMNSSSPSAIQGFTSAIRYNSTEVTMRADASPVSGAPFDSALALAQGLWPPTGADAISLANGSTITSPFGGYQYVVIEPVWPAVNYASALVFELRNSSSGLVVRANFKNGTMDEEFHPSGMIFGDWNGGQDVPFDTFSDYFSSLRGPNTSAISWCNACGNPYYDYCILANITGSLLNANKSSDSSPSVTTIVQAVTTRNRISPVGAGFLGAGLAAVLMSALFGFLLFLGVLPQGSGARKLHRFSSGSYRRGKRRGDELELQSEV
ncbi:hypothetical protein EIP86_005423 [Pleurotus ostreatoroseus]|nr:hypothetical protein EIP86_005423 [Pleurotus ostreatoroseus]